MMRSHSRPQSAFRPQLEVLEDRTLPATRLVIPLNLPADNVTTFHTLSVATSLGVLSPGDVIQIEPGSSPGKLFNALIDNAANLTIQGNPAFAVSELPEFSTGDAITIGAARAGFTLKHLPFRVQGGAITFTANGTITDCHVTDDISGTALHFNATTAAALLNSRVVTVVGGPLADGTVEVTAAAGAANRIEHTEFYNVGAGSTTPLLLYQGAASVTDVVRDNSFFGGGAFNIPLVSVEGGADGVTFHNNALTSSLANVLGFRVLSGSQNVRLQHNTINFSAGGSSSRAIFVDPGASGATSVVIVNNRLHTGNAGIGLDFGGTLGGLSARVEGNDFHNNLIGVRVSTTVVANIDLGGGTQSSKGANNFRGFITSATSTSGAIVASPPGGQTIIANGNLFHNTAITTPDDVFFDFNDDATRADVQAAGSLSTNQSFVQTLYIRFFKRIGNLADPADAGAWVNALNSGATVASVANSIIRSPESLGHQVDALYRQFLGRDADSAGRATAVAALQGGDTLENLIRKLVSSAEYAVRFASNTAWVQSLYYQLLGRVPNSADLASMVAAVETSGRLSVSNIFVTSAEFRRRDVRRMYEDLLHRTPSTADVNATVATGLDLLSLLVRFARSNEYLTNG